MRNRLNDVALGAVLGSLASFFLDPDRGRRRRAMLRDRTAALGRRASARAERAGSAVGARVYGMSQQALHLREEPKDYDDVTLARKVETELFRPADVPKGQIDVNVQKGVVQLRGEVPRPDLIDDLVDRARGIQGVRAVENLLHLPGTEAPMHQ
jgi:osmotically-inducible protein OsmY